LPGGLTARTVTAMTTRWVVLWSDDDDFLVATTRRLLERFKF